MNEIQAAQNIKWWPDKRLEFIDFRLAWEGKINRSDLTDFFGISIPQASLDLARYIEKAPQNLIYNKRSKVYLTGKDFKPLFDTSSSQQYLIQLLNIKQNIIESSHSFIGSQPNCEILPRISRHTPSHVLFPILVAIREQRAIQIDYVSMTQPEMQTRIINPHSLAYDGKRWHVRAYCQMRHDYRDFLIARIQDIQILDYVSENLMKDDAQWNNIVNFEIQPEPSLSDIQKKAIADDYEMTNGVLHMSCREAMQFYVLKDLGFTDNCMPISDRNQIIMRKI